MGTSGAALEECGHIKLISNLWQRRHAGGWHADGEWACGASSSDRWARGSSSNRWVKRQLLQAAVHVAAMRGGAWAPVTPPTGGWQCLLLRAACADDDGWWQAAGRHWRWQAGERRRWRRSRLAVAAAGWAAKCHASEKLAWVGHGQPRICSYLANL
jgi:hypothetical protein